MDMHPLSIGEVVGVDRLDLDAAGSPRGGALFVDLDSAATAEPADLERAARVLALPGPPAVGVCRRAWPPAATALAAQLDLAITAREHPGPQAIRVDDLDATAELIDRTVSASPRASIVLCQVLRAAAGPAAVDGLAMESLAYSTLLAGPEFRRWRAATPRRAVPARSGLVRLARDGDTLVVTMDHPERRNAFSATMRDELVEALTVAAADPTLHQIRLHGAGPAFCSGGDLDEFGTTTDVTVAYLVRTRQSAGALLSGLRDRAVAHLHGACIGAGIELPAFAGRVIAAPDTLIRLPELAMGLIPGAGGTVSLPRRIGRWRTAYLALTGTVLPVATALDWGLVDEILPAPGAVAPGEAAPSGAAPPERARRG